MTEPTKRICIEYDEQSKAAVAKVIIEYTGDSTPDNDTVLAETNELFAKAQTFALNATMRRNK